MVYYRYLRIDKRLPEATAIEEARSMTIIEHHEQLEDAKRLEAVWALLCRYDRSFIPPLSGRASSSQSDLTGSEATAGAGAGGPRSYYEALKEQSFLLAVDEAERVVGFMSYRPAHVIDDLDETVTAYVTTVIVEEEQRGRGVTTAFYQALLARLSTGDTAATRTWSTNDSHIRILAKLGFGEVRRIEDGRGPGIDTVYYRKRVEGAVG